MQKVKRVYRVYVVTPVRIIYSSPLNSKEYKSEIKGIIEEIKEGAREYAYTANLKEEKSIVVTDLRNLPQLKKPLKVDFYKGNKKIKFVKK